MSTASWLERIRPGDHWHTLLAGRAPGLLAGVLALALAAQTARLVTNLAGATPPPAPTVWHPHVQATRVADIIASHLFGRAPHSAEALADDAPRTQLPLVLSGVMAARDPSAGLAILGPSARTAKVYAVGDSIPGGATLDAVLPRKVLLRHNGVIRSLALPRQVAPPAAPPSVAALPRQDTSAPKFAAHVRALVAQHPAVLTKLLRPEPVFSNGHQLGFRVYPGSDATAFAQLGLKSGDLVLAINGTALDNPRQDQQILNSLGSSSEATVTVLRDGQQHTLTLNLAQVEQAAKSLTSTHAPPSAAHPRSPRAVPFGNRSRR